MPRNRNWTLLLGVVLTVNAVLILGAADGRVEGYVSSAICLFAGIVNVVSSFRPRPSSGEQPPSRPGTRP